MTIYIIEKKNNISLYKDVIKDAAKINDIPELLLAGVAFNEFGGDPMWVDGLAYNVRAFDWSGPNWVDENLTVTKNPKLTSFGNISIQVRRAEAILGYKNATSSELDDIITSLKNPISNIYISARHLGELRDIDFKGAKGAQLTEEQIKIIGTRFNRGMELSKEKIQQNMGYGQKIYNNKQRINRALYGK